MTEQVPWRDRLLEILTTGMGGFVSAHQQRADAADRQADSMAELARAATRSAKEVRRFVRWLTSVATMDEASAALGRALHPEVKGF